MFKYEGLEDLEKLAQRTYNKALQACAEGLNDSSITLDWDKGARGDIAEVTVNDFTYRLSSIHSHLNVSYKNIPHPFFRIPYEGNPDEIWLGTAIARRLSIDKAMRHGIVKPYR